MNTQVSPQVQAGHTAPRTIKLEPNALVDTITALIPPNQIGHSSEKNMELVNRLMSLLKDEDGTPVKISPALQNLITLIFRPTEDVQRTVLRHGFEEEGFKLDPETERIFVLLFAPPQVGDFLAKNVNPATGKPFIVKEKKRGAKQNMFASLVAMSPTPAPATPTEAVSAESPVTAATEGETTGEPSDSGAEQAEQEVEATPAAPAKPAAKAVKK